MTAKTRNIGLLVRMEGFLQAVVGLPVDASGTRFLPAMGLEDAREMGSDGFFANETTPDGRLVKQIASLIEEIDDIDMDGDGSRVISEGVVLRARSFAAQALAMANAPDL